MLLYHVAIKYRTSVVEVFMGVPVFVHPMIVGVRGSRCMGMRLRLSVCCRRKTVNELDTHDAVGIGTGRTLRKSEVGHLLEIHPRLRLGLAAFF